MFWFLGRGIETKLGTDRLELVEKGFYFCFMGSAEFDVLGWDFFDNWKGFPFIAAFLASPESSQWVKLKRRGG